MTDQKEKPVHVVGRPLPPMTADEKRRMSELFAHCPKGHVDYRADIERGDCSACKRAELDARAKD